MCHKDAAFEVRFRKDVGERGGMVDVETSLQLALRAGSYGMGDCGTGDT
jgi:hypothetical protein